MKKEMTLREALRELFFREMEKTKDMILIGENLHYGGSLFSKIITSDFHKKFGKDRVIDTPVSENGIVGIAFGATLAGTIVIAEVYSADFLCVVGNEIFNDIPKWRYQHRFGNPIRLVIRAPMGLHARGSGGPEHSQCPEAFIHNAAGLTIVIPSTVRDAVGLFRTALKCGNPVVFLEHRQVYDIKDEIDMDDEFTVPIGKSSVFLEGRDITVVAWALMKLRAAEAAKILKSQGVSVEIIDPRTIKPMDFDLILKSVEKTGKLLVVEETPRTGSIGGEIISNIVEQKADVKCKRLTIPDIPLPCNIALEASAIPSVNDIVEKVRSMA